MDGARSLALQGTAFPPRFVSYTGTKAPHLGFLANTVITAEIKVTLFLDGQ